MKILIFAFTCLFIVFFMSGPFPIKAAQKVGPEMQKDKSDYQIVSDDFNIIIYAAEKMLLLYKQAENAYKPYIKELNTPAGINILLDSPGDHKHHHGLMLAWKVNGINFWEETKESGYQISEDYRDVSTLDNGAAFVVKVNWVTNDKNITLLSEIRSIRAEFSQTHQANLITWQSIFTGADAESATILSGAHYNGLGLRFQRSMDKTGQFRSAEGKSGEIFRGEERLTPDRWCAYFAEAEGKKVTVVMFDGPQNPRQPATWFTMRDPFAYLSATLKLHEDPFELTSEETLMLTYGVAVWDGHVEKEKIENLYTDWIKKIR